MKKVFRTAAILAVASTAVFTSCVKKNLTEDSNDILNSQKDEEYYESNGSVSAKFAGDLEGQSGYSDQEYSISRTFSFLNDNVNGSSLPSNHLTTQRNVNTQKNNLDFNCDYIVKNFTIKMYGASGESKTDYATRESITINFNYYEGTLPKHMISQGIKIKTPTEITVGYNLAYIPENTIDLLDIEGEIKPTSTVSSEIKNQVTITDFSFDPASGDISFTFSAEDNTVGGGNEKITEGKVKTTILVNQILRENSQKD